MTSESKPRPLWQPRPELVQSSNLTDYANFLKKEYGVDFQDYESLHRWSVEHLETFWESLIPYFDVTLHSPYERVLSGKMPQARWFEGATLNYAEQVFRQKTADHPALLVASESGPLTELSWAELEHQTAVLSNWLRKAGVGPGDRVAGYLPTIPEATVALLATIAVGAVWTSCSPDFGTASVLDRFRQVEPKVLIAVTGYRYGGKFFDKTEAVGELVAGLPSLEKVINLTPGPSPAERGGKPNFYTTDAPTWKHLKPLARTNRRNPTKAEDTLWQALRGGKLGYKFRRQHAIATYIVDFVNIDTKLIVEVDGSIHDVFDNPEYDWYRTQVLQENGFRVIRFRNEEVLTQLNEVLSKIEEHLNKETPPEQGSPSQQERGSGGEVSWQDVLRLPPEPLTFTPVPFAHPIWILYSSGTTGLPKAITHGHGGVLLEHLKYLVFHNDVRPGERFFWYTTTGWMMWNFLNASLLAGATAVLYDGSPGFPDLNVLWKLAQDARITHFGTSAPFLMSCQKAEITPGETFDLSALRTVGSTGSPLAPESFDYVYERVKSDVWLSSISGGTDVCTAWVGGCPWEPVLEGEIQCRCLGCNMVAFDQNAQPVVGEVGEMVIAQPMPSMPVFFWNDPDFARYRASYFEEYPGLWRHGDFLKITPRGSVIIYGRSDATLNRQGVRIGTAEIYRAVESIPEIADSLIVHLERSDGSEFMPLFVVPRQGVTLDEALVARLKSEIRRQYSPRHVPDAVLAVPTLPYTLSGKKLELPVKKILLGQPLENVVNPGSVRNPEALDWFVTWVAEQGGAGTR